MYKLIYTENCNRCDIIRNLLKQKNIQFEELYAYSPEGIKLCNELNIVVAGTILDENNNIININDL